MIKLMFHIGKALAMLEQLLCPKHHWMIKSRDGRAWCECVKCLKVSPGVNLKGRIV